eukprot:CAMPEP_0170503804 /NCGR_PEP_ID=MMETSP0208-20121228/45954_1 /TAXON_ID=197538 /ORGANISM="Strombidium inclinatum, Strain S3" /LENGTH=372 /DNA_ID=CAMNT_0010783661 /DNA_START=4093 /DNA_END=5214 /DNA_ORIENTATION=+
MKTSELILPSILYKLNTKHQQLADDRSNCTFHKESGLPTKSATTKLLPYYHLPSSDELNTWVMYLENILQEVYSVEGTEQILLEALNYLALKLYFGEETPGFGGFSGPMSERISSPMMGSSRSLGGGFGEGDAMGMNHDNLKKLHQDQGDPTDHSEVFTGGPGDDLDHLWTQLRAEDGGLYLPYRVGEELLDGPHLPVPPHRRPERAWELLAAHLAAHLLETESAEPEHREPEGDDSEFSEELFDAALNNLINHQQHFRDHQNTKLSRVLEQQDKLNRENLLSNLNKESSIQVNPKREANFNSRRSNMGSNGPQVYRITSFEEELDREKKRRSRFEMPRSSQVQAENLNETVNGSPGEVQVQRVGMHAYKRS